MKNSVRSQDSCSIWRPYFLFLVFRRLNSSFKLSRWCQNINLQIHPILAGAILSLRLPKRLDAGRNFDISTWQGIYVIYLFYRLVCFSLHVRLSNKSILLLGVQSILFFRKSKIMMQFRNVRSFCWQVCLFSVCYAYRRFRTVRCCLFLSPGSSIRSQKHRVLWWG